MKKLLITALVALFFITTGIALAASTDLADKNIETIANAKTDVQGATGLALSDDYTMRALNHGEIELKFNANGDTVNIRFAVHRNGRLEYRGEFNRS